MLEPQRMDRVLIVGTKDVMEPTINTLHDLNLLHIEDYIEEEEYFHIGKPLTKATSLSEKLLKLRSIKSYLGTKETPSRAAKPGECPERARCQPRVARAGRDPADLGEKRARFLDQGA